MKTLKYTWIICLLLVTLPMSAGKRKAVYVIIDGVEKHFLQDVHPKTIFDIAQRGNFGRAYCGGEIGTPNQTITISAVGYTNILTGTWMNKHHVVSNSDIQTNYHYWNIFRIAKEQSFPVSTAVFSSWTDNVTKLVGVGHPGNANLKVDYVYDGYDLDSIRFPKKPEDRQIYDIDSTVCHQAAQCIKDKAPDVSWVYLWYTDDAAHLHGFGDCYRDYLLCEDRQLQKIWEAVQYREKKYGEEWMVIITTDHGRDLLGYDHGGQSETERNIWLTTNVKDVNPHFQSADLSQVDINPTICRWMGFHVDPDVAWEQEGIPFIGDVDIDHLRLLRYENKVKLSWDYYHPNVPVTIYASATNHFKDGGKDTWIEVGKTEAGKGYDWVDLSRLEKSKFYKFTVVAPHNHLSRWYVLR